MDTKEIIQQLRDYSEHFDNIFINFSGGKDSLIILHLATKALKEVQVVYVDTTMAFPECNEYVRKLCDEWGVELLVLKRRDTDFWGLVERWGFPHTRFRWCMQEMKSLPLMFFNLVRNEQNLHVTGTTIGKSSVRREVYSIREMYYFNQKIGSYVFHPILDWDERTAERYRERYKLPMNPCYSIYGQGGNCYYCPYIKSKEYYLKLAKLHPELFRNIVEAEKRMRHGGAAIYLKKGEVLHLSKLNPQ